MKYHLLNDYRRAATSSRLADSLLKTALVTLEGDGDMATEPVTTERLRRERMIDQLESRASLNDVPPPLLRELRIYRGQAGIWTDHSNTSMDSAPHGITVSVLHTGKRYNDDLRTSGVTYHVPVTHRIGRDEAEISATKRAMELELPVFVITPGVTPKGRQVRRGKILGFDERAQSFEIRFE
jgi:putative restriction endonuclease